MGHLIFCPAFLGGSLVGVWNGWGYGIAIFRALNFQISEPEIWQKSLFLRNFSEYFSNFPGKFEKYFSDSGKWPFHTPPIHTPTKCRPIFVHIFALYVWGATKFTSVWHALKGLRWPAVLCRQAANRSVWHALKGSHWPAVLCRQTVNSDEGFSSTLFPVPSVPKLLRNYFVLKFWDVKITLQHQKLILPEAHIRQKLR